jgi:hypothetical protein
VIFALSQCRKMCVLNYFFDGVHSSDDFYSSIRRILDCGSALESPFQGGSDDTPLVVVEVSSVRSRNLERVGCGDFIVAVIIVVVLTVMILNSWFLDKSLR